MTPLLFFTLVVATFGLLFGSFANVCIHRIPRGESVVSPRSRCPHCGEMIAWYDNIPVLSWLLLRGRCRHCAHSISMRYPVMEAFMGLSWGWFAYHFGPLQEHMGPTPVLLYMLTLISLLWILTFIDLETGLLPNVLTLPGILIGLLFNLWIGNWLDSLIGAVAGYGAFWLVAMLFLRLTGREGMGFGDFKLLAMLGAFLGWQALPFIIFFSSITGSVVGGLYLLLADRERHAEIPFGPYLAVAGVVWLLWGQRIVDWYLSLLQV